MTVSLFMRFQVKDYASWLHPNPADVDRNMRSAGAVAYSLHRNADDPNMLIIRFQFADGTALKSFVAWMEALPGEDKNFGALPGTLEMWVGEDVQGYSSQP